MLNENELLNLALKHIKKVSEFNPYKSYEGIKSLEDFQQLISTDPAFGVLGLDNDKYIRARFGGNLVTSLHRKVGDMYETLFAYLLKQSFELNDSELRFNVEVKIGYRIQTRSTDGLIRKNKFNQNIPETWQQYEGVGFEVSSCYQIGDSKRIQADYDMSLALKFYKILPVMLVFCNTSLKSPLLRLSKSWDIYEGENSFNLVKLITGFDLYRFLQTNSNLLKKEVDNIFSNF